ncbi:LytTR family DNA-binding domain-containing protein, partial [Acidobacteria bacterium AH-259-G07]|nr:LytTR family DNA-binding domain-containing protein [Acidobacteria bacterium AH-259-G07]
DEEPARDRLRQLLSPFEDIEIVGEAQDGEQAIEIILEIKPDLVFLDIQMPACSGMEVAASLPSPRPQIIFCTAYDQYAIDAFELHAVDYLMKPVSRARLAKAIERVRTMPATDVDPQLERAARALGTGTTRFLAKRANRFTVVPQSEVLYFASEEGLTRLYTRETCYWMEPSLSELQDRLAPSKFHRISRQAVVNLDAVREVVPLAGGYGEVRLKNGTPLDVSRRRMKELMQKLEGK